MSIKLVNCKVYKLKMVPNTQHPSGNVCQTPSFDRYKIYRPLAGIWRKSLHFCWTIAVEFCTGHYQGLYISQSFKRNIKTFLFDTYTLEQCLEMCIYYLVIKCKIIIVMNAVSAKGLQKNVKTSLCEQTENPFYFF